MSHQISFFSRAKPAPKRETLDELSVSAIVKYLDARRNTLTLAEIWEERLEDACGNVFKATQADSGGAAAFMSLAKRCLEIAASAFKRDRNQGATQALAEEIYAFVDKRHKAVRITQITRIAMFKIRYSGGSLQGYYQEVARMVNQTLSNANKRQDRLSKSDNSLYQKIKRYEN